MPYEWISDLLNRRENTSATVSMLSQKPLAGEVTDLRENCYCCCFVCQTVRRIFLCMPAMLLPALVWGSSLQWTAVTQKLITDQSAESKWLLKAKLNLCNPFHGSDMHRRGGRVEGQSGVEGFLQGTMCPLHSSLPSSCDISKDLHRIGSVGRRGIRRTHHSLRV